MFGSSSKLQRSTSPFRSRKGSPAPATASPSTATRNSGGRPGSSSSERSDFSKPKENVTVTVRFRPLSARELKKGDETAWYADGDCTVRNEYNPDIAYAFDRVFGPATTTRHVYDVAAHHVVRGAMNGVNGTIFAYGVTSSGKTHTMHGVQKSPGIIPLAVKDIFEIIQETPEREFLLRVSYLEIYNEVINDLLDPIGQNLRIREDSQGTYIEGIKDEVVLSPAHALSLIATGEEHRHVGSNNFNLFSSRSHTIFTLILDEKSLIKKYQKEISNLKQELQRLKNSMMENPCINVTKQEDLVSLKLQLEAGQVKLQSRLEEEEQAKAALMGRIQRLTKLILVSTKSTKGTNIPQKAVYKRRNLFGEDELAYLPDGKREYAIDRDDDDGSLSSEVMMEGCVNMAHLDEMAKDHKKNRRKGMLGWFKSRKPEHLVGLSSSADSQSSASMSPVSCSTSSLNRGVVSDGKHRWRKSVSRKGDDPSDLNSYPEGIQASTGNGGSHAPQIATTTTDQMDLLNEQVKLLAGDIALCTSSLKGLSEQAVNNPEDSEVEAQMHKLKNEISEKKMQIHQLEQRTIGSLEAGPQTSNTLEMSQALAKLATQLNEKTFELEIKSADNRILEEQLQMKISENAEMQETILLLRQQLSTSVHKRSSSPEGNNLSILEAAVLSTGFISSADRNKEGKESPMDATTPTSVISLNRMFSQEDPTDYKIVTNSNSQAAVMENLKHENVKLAEEKDGLELHNQKLAEEASYAKELAAAAAVELRNLTEEVAKLSCQNAKLIVELASAKEACCRSECCQPLPRVKQGNNSYTTFDARSRKPECGQVVEDLQKELNARYQREALLKATLSEKERVECELQKRLNEAKRHEKDLQEELANVWGLVANMRDSGIECGDIFPDGIGSSDFRLSKIANRCSSINDSLPGGSEKHDNIDKMSTREELIASYLKERRRSQELESLISRLKGEDLAGLDVATLEELQNVHVEAITKICQAKYANHIL